MMQTFWGDKVNN